MKAGAVPLWSYYCAPLRINYLRATKTFDTAYRRKSRRARCRYGASIVRHLESTNCEAR